MIERYVLWIGFQRHCQGVMRRRSAKYVKQRREQGRDGLGREQRRRTAAQVDGFQTLATVIPGLAPGVSRAYRRQLSKHRLHVLPRRDALAHRDGEVAVGAAALAEGDVDVEVLHGGNYSATIIYEPTPTQTPFPVVAGLLPASQAPSVRSAQRPCRPPPWRRARPRVSAPSRAHPTSCAATRSDRAADPEATPQSYFEQPARDRPPPAAPAL